MRCGGRGDLDARVKGHDPFGRHWVVQRKHRSKWLSGPAVGTPDLQTLNATGRPVHKSDVVVLLTNGRFTDSARDLARQQRLHLVDQAYRQGRPHLAQSAPHHMPVLHTRPRRGP